MKPTKPGIWEWFEEDGTKRLVHVCDVGVDTPHLRVCWWGSYYDVHDRVNEPIYDCDLKQCGTVSREAEWPDRWGKYVGPSGCVTEDNLYLQPTPEEYAKLVSEFGKTRRGD